jgi:hypothetical protein
MALDNDERQGMVIAAGLNDGYEFDWAAFKWVNPNA